MLVRYVFLYFYIKESCKYLRLEVMLSLVSVFVCGRGLCTMTKKIPSIEHNDNKYFTDLYSNKNWGRN